MNPGEHSGSEDKYIWRKVQRKDPPKRSVAERVADFVEVYSPYDAETVREQASRCVQCPDPSCMEGHPLESPIPNWLALTAEGKFREASEVMLSGGSLPEICCHLSEQDRLAESACVLNAESDPVPIGAIGRFLLDYAVSHGGLEALHVAPNGFKVAVLGCGPCGLVCAEELSRRGYAVTVVDCHDVPGGFLASGVSVFSLDKTLLSRRVEILKSQGVQFQLGTPCGDGLSLEDLRRDYDAVFYGLCGDHARPLDIPGAGLGGIFQALPFLMQQHTKMPLETGPIDVRGKRVVVLGGGDTAMDCLRTAIRCGARRVTCLYRRDQASMPAHAEERENAVEEGVHFVFCAQAVAAQGNPAGEVVSLRCVQTKLGAPDSSGRPSVSTIPGTDFDEPADVVLVAFGFASPVLPRSGGFERLAADDRGVLKVDENQMTSLPGVFAGGDAVYGYGQLAEAVRHARGAARAIDQYIASGKGNRA